MTVNNTHAWLQTMTPDTLCGLRFTTRTGHRVFISSKDDADRVHVSGYGYITLRKVAELIHQGCWTQG